MLAFPHVLVAHTYLTHTLSYGNLVAQKSKETRDNFFLTMATVEMTWTFQEQGWQQNQWLHEGTSTTSSAIWGTQSLFSKDSNNDLIGMWYCDSSCLASLFPALFLKAGSIRPSTSAVSRSMSFLFISVRIRFHCSQLKALMVTLRT